MWRFLITGLVMFALAVAGHGVAAAQPHGTASPSWTVTDARPVAVDGGPSALSPDGRWLAGPGLGGEFCVWEAETLDPDCDGRDLPAVIPRSIAWSLDSTAVAFSVDMPTYLIDSDVLVFEVESGRLVNLTGGEPGAEEFARLDLDREAADPLPIDLFPAWSPDGGELLFARTTWGAGAMGTTLMTVGRAGGEPVEVRDLRPRIPFQVISPMRWLDDGSILYSQLSPDSEDAANGIWRLPPDGDPQQLVPGSVTDEIPLPSIADLSSDGNTMSVTSLGRLFSGPAEIAPVYFLVDITSGEVTSVEELVGAIASPDDLAEGNTRGRLIAPARFAPDGGAMITLSRAEPDIDLLVVDVDEQGETHELAVPGGLVGEGLPAERTIDVGIDWAANDTAFIGLVGDNGQGGGLLLALERTATDDPGPATPLPPCSCTPPAQSWLYPARTVHVRTGRFHVDPLPGNEASRPMRSRPAAGADTFAALSAGFESARARSGQ